MARVIESLDLEDSLSDHERMIAHLSGMFDAIAKQRPGDIHRSTGVAFEVGIYNLLVCSGIPQNKMDYQYKYPELRVDCDIKVGDMLLHLKKSTRPDRIDAAMYRINKIKKYHEKTSHAFLIYEDFKKANFIRKKTQTDDVDFVLSVHDEFEVKTLINRLIAHITGPDRPLHKDDFMTI